MQHLLKKSLQYGLALAVIILSAEARAENKPITVKYATSASGASVLSPKLDRRDQAIRLNEAGVELILRGDRNGGISKIKQALAFDPLNATILYNLAGVYVSGNEGKLAIPILKKALEIDPNDLAFLNRLAEAYVSEKNPEMAIKTYEQILTVDETYNETLLKLGTLYGMWENWEKAEETLRRADKVMGPDSRVLGNLGSILVVRKNYNAALEVLTRAQKLDPTPENAVAMGIAAESLGETAKALSYYNKAKELGETGGELEQHIAELEEALKKDTAK